MLEADRHGRQGDDGQGHAARGQEHARVLRADREASAKRRASAPRSSRRSRATRSSSASTRSPATRVEGYLFPDTYQFRVGEKPRVVLERLITRHQEVWNELVAKHPKDTAKLKDKLGWTDRDILTMASIVEKEAVEPAERPRIAQVFINRLTSPTFKPKRLETDPTIRYGCLVPAAEVARRASRGTSRVRRQASRRAAIACTARSSTTRTTRTTRTSTRACRRARSRIRGGARWRRRVTRRSDYLFFVATDEREHAFAKTIAEHKRNVDKYVRARRELGADATPMAHRRDSSSVIRIERSLRIRPHRSEDADNEPLRVSRDRQHRPARRDRFGLSGHLDVQLCRRGTVDPMSLVGQIAELQNYATYKELSWEGSFEDYLDAGAQEPAGHAQRVPAPLRHGAVARRRGVHRQQEEARPLQVLPRRAARRHGRGVRPRRRR